MYYAVLALIVLTALLTLRGLIALIADPWAPEKNQVILSKLLLCIGVPGCALFLIPTCIMLFTEESPWLSVCFLAFSWLSGSMILGYLNCRITFSEDEFTVKNFLGFKKTFAYTDIDQFRHTPHHDWVYIGRRRVLIDEFAVNGDRFLELARRRYRIHRNGRPMPTAKNKWDIFNGNVDDPGGFIFAFSLIYVVLIVVFVILFPYIQPKTAGDLQSHTICPAYAEPQNDGDLYLYVVGSDMHYRISDFAEMVPETDAFLSAIDEGTPLEVLALEYPYADDPFYDIYSITAQGTVFLTLDASNQHKYSDTELVIYLFIGMLLLWTAVVVMTVLVGRNPDKYPQWLVHMFIKPGYIRSEKQTQTSRRKTK